MAVGRTKAGMGKHFDQIIKTWAGKECIHRIITETIDDMGNIIERSNVDSTIYGIVSPADLKGKNQPIGYAQPGDLTGLFKYDNDIIISDQLTEYTTRQDHIIYEGFEYRIENQQIAYDINVQSVSHEPIFTNNLLRKLST